MTSDGWRTSPTTSRRSWRGIYYVHVSGFDEPCYFAGRSRLRARVGQAKRIGPFHARARGVRAPPDAGRAGCRSYKLTWRLKDKFFGVGRYTVTLRIRDAEGAWSRTVSRSSYTPD
jgi:hypothetical protein